MLVMLNATKVVNSYSILRYQNMLFLKHSYSLLNVFVLRICFSDSHFPSLYGTSIHPPNNVVSENPSLMASVGHSLSFT